MTQQILMILPSTEDEAPRLVGPFLTEATATAWADTKKIDPIRRVIRPLESPTSIYGYGRHALIPSPEPRRMVGMLPGEGALRGRNAAKVPPTGVAGALAAWEAKKEEVRQGPKVNPTLRIDAEREDPPPGALTGGIRHWITGEAMESAPRAVLDEAEAVATWSGPVAQFNHATTDGRVLQLVGESSGGWLAHFTRVPVGVWVMVKNVGALPIGLCERVRVEDDWLIAEGRISLAHFQKASPGLFRQATDATLDQSQGIIPAAIDVTGGQRGYSAGEHIIGGQWELERIVFGSVPAWPGCYVRLGTGELILRG